VPARAHEARPLPHQIAVLGLARPHGAAAVQALGEGAGELVGHVLCDYDPAVVVLGILPNSSSSALGPPVELAIAMTCLGAR